VDPDRTAQDIAARLAAGERDIRRQIADLARQFGAIVEAMTAVATDDEHDPEGHTIAFERAQTAALLARARARLADVEWAREQLAAGRYGRCEECGRPIAPERLDARPTARTCIGCASHR
jgi:RNA polymerase-binding transcription factor DksA